MKDLSIKELVTACNGTFCGSESLLEEKIDGVVIDSRIVKSNYVFVAIKGENTDGHIYAESAVKAGAKVVISEQDLSADVPYIKVESSPRALQDIAKYYRMKKNFKVIGITGSVGKTSTKELVASVCATKFKTYKTIGNFNNELGLPLTLLQVEDEQVVVLEMGISDFGEMHLLADIARPDICIITNIGYCHLETLGDRAGVLKAKTEIFDFANADTKVILNKDDDMLSGVTFNAPVFYGIENKDSYVRADNIVDNGISGIMFDAYVGDKMLKKVCVPLPGMHMVYNALAGIAVGCILGIEEKDILAGIMNLKAVGGRNNIIKTDKYVLIDDCYNANPVSMKAAIDVLSKADKGDGRRVAILGDMFELGSEEAAYHRSIGEHINRKKIDVVVCIGSLSKNIASAIDSSDKIQVCEYKDVDSFLEEKDKVLVKGDIILIKASHGMNFKKIVEELSL